jgi:hypothetical protein
MCGTLSRADTAKEPDRLQLVFEALKIDKIPQRSRARLWFVLLLGFAAALFYTAPADVAMELFRTQIHAFLESKGPFPLPPPEWFSMLWRNVALVVVALFFIILYAVHWLTAQSDASSDANAATRRALKAFPRCFVFALAMVFPYLLSLPIMQLPFYVLASMFSMVFMLVAMDQKRLPEAMGESASMTYGMKFFIFISFVMLRALMRLGSNLLLLPFSKSVSVGSLVRGFFYALQTLAYGRLLGILYRALTMNEGLFPTRALDDL